MLGMLGLEMGMGMDGEGLEGGGVRRLGGW